jgi:hypothetical protein
VICALTRVYVRLFAEGRKDGDIEADFHCLAICVSACWEALAQSTLTGNVKVPKRRCWSGLGSIWTFSYGRYLGL